MVKLVQKMKERIFIQLVVRLLKKQEFKKSLSTYVIFKSHLACFALTWIAVVKNQIYYNLTLFPYSSQAFSWHMHKYMDIPNTYFCNYAGKSWSVIITKRQHQLTGLGQFELWAKYSKFISYAIIGNKFVPSSWHKKPKGRLSLWLQATRIRSEAFKWRRLCNAWRT